MKHLFIINPVAGNGKALKYIPLIKECFEGRTEEFFIEITEYPCHATELARKYALSENYRIYSIGGDGTLNEVLNGMADSQSSLAVIPGGSGNDFIKSICPDLDMHHILERTIEGKEKKVDLATVNGRYFINISSVGFDAEVVLRADRFKNIPPFSGRFAYLMGVMAALLKNRSNSLEISIDDGQPFNKNLLMAIAANGRYYGGGMLPAPHAEVNDGEFDICLVEKVSIAKIMLLLPKFIKGRHLGFKEVSFHKGKRISIKCSSPIALNIDGEVKRVKEVLLEVVPGGIDLVIPKTLLEYSSKKDPSMEMRPFIP